MPVKWWGRSAAAEAEPPPEVTGFTAEAALNAVALEWDDVGADSYVVYQDAAAVQVVTGATSTEVPATGAADYSVAAATLGDATDPESVEPVVGESFGYTGAVQSFVVPVGVTTLTVDAYGAQGSKASIFAEQTGGKGGRVRCNLAVTPGETLQINVGGRTGWNGGGTAGAAAAGNGGGASDVRRGVTVTADNFDRANFTALATSSSGHTWTVRSGSFDTISNTARGYGGTNLKIATIDHGSPDGTYSVKSDAGAGGLSNDASWGMCLRYVDINNYLTVWIYRNWQNPFEHRLYVDKKVAGVLTTIDGPTTVTWVANLQLIAVLNGNSLQVTANNVTRTVDVTGLPAGNHHGLYDNVAAEQQWDDWSGVSGTRLIVAPGGGGAGGGGSGAGYGGYTGIDNSAVGIGGTPSGSAGKTSSAGYPGGGGATTSAGGGVGSNLGNVGTAGSLGTGGNGGTSPDGAGGGGGGGKYGGGGGRGAPNPTYNGGGGGGGSGLSTGVAETLENGARNGDGLITLSW